MDDMAAIHFAAQKGHLEVVRALVSAGASFKAATRKGMTPLHFAAQGSHLELVKYLAKKGASLSVKTKAGKTPLDLATNDEVRTFLEGFVKSDKNEESRNGDKAEESDPKQNEGSNPKADEESDPKEKEESNRKAAEESDPKEKEESNRKAAEESDSKASSLGFKGDEPPTVAVDEEEGERGKRKVNENDATEDSSKPKKARVKLSHLQSSDDAEEEEN
ncbi:hypothetical protein KIW84_024127 [Lathyrus oleraceus]|uniref:Uncharacterized protein n=3 Tax=Pisum sativum TaxID=3888 RepID=A0A9D4YGV9_PEA|nr:hypothetical protein KIW84_024127 [Pisum sativum]